MSLKLQQGSGGEVIASDKDASEDQHCQLKFADGLADSSTEIQAGNGTAANALLATLASDSNGQAALAEGTAEIGEVSIAGSKTAAASLGKRADDPHTSASTGVMGLFVRQDTPSNLSGTDGDYAPLSGSDGRVWTSWTTTETHGEPRSFYNQPVLSGAEASETDGSDPGSVSEGDVSQVQSDLYGLLLVDDGSPERYYASDNQSTPQTDTQLKAAATGPIFITDVMFSNGATAGTFELVEDTGGTPVTVFGPIYLGINGNYKHEFDTPLMLSDAVDVGYTTTAVTTHSVFISGWARSYNPLMMTFNGSDGTYYDTSQTMAGNVFTIVGRMDVPSQASAQEFMRIREVGGSGAHRVAITIQPNNHATADVRDKLEILVQDSSAATAARLPSLATVADGSEHTFFFSWDYSTGAYVFKIDGTDAVNVGSARYVAPSVLTAATGSAFYISIGSVANSSGWLNGKIGFIGYHEVTATWSDFFAADGSPKELDETGWTEWTSQPLYWEAQGEMTAQEGSAGNLTKFGTITGPA